MDKKTKSRTIRKGLQGAAFIILFYSLLAVLSLALFGATHILANDATLGYVEIFGSFVLLLNILILRLGYIEVAKNLLLTIIFLLLIVMLITGGTENTGAFWVFVFPVTAFFLAGKRAGMWWLAALLAMIAAVGLLSNLGIVQSVYSGVTLRQLAISVAVVTIGIYVYQKTREQLVLQGNESRSLLRAEKARAASIVQNISEGILTTDAKGTITYANPAAEKSLGWSPSELIGKFYSDAIPMIDKAGHVVAPENRPLARGLSQQETTNLSTLYRRKDGKVIPVSITATPLVVDGKATGVIATFRDITEEQDVVRTKSEFVTLVSHQLRTPLSAISWVSELLLNGDAGKMSREQRDYIGAISQSNQRMAALVGEMLTVSSLELHSLPVIPQAIEIRQFVSGIVKEQLFVAGRARQTVREAYDKDLPEWSCDPKIVKTILRNLLSNAFKYTPKDGQITVRVSTNPAHKLTPDSKGSIELSISDTGYGIPKSATKKIFSKFFRAQNIVSKDTDGTGLGLYIVKALLDYVGGQITFSSEEGKGSTFTASLPIEGMDPYRPGRSGMESAVYGEGRD